MLELDLIKIFLIKNVHVHPCCMFFSQIFTPISSVLLYHITIIVAKTYRKSVNNFITLARTHQLCPFICSSFVATTHTVENVHVYLKITSHIKKTRYLELIVRVFVFCTLRHTFVQQLDDFCSTLTVNLLTVHTL